MPLQIPAPRSRPEKSLSSAYAPCYLSIVRELLQRGGAGSGLFPVNQGRDTVTAHAAKFYVPCRALSAIPGSHPTLKTCPRCGMWTVDGSQSDSPPPDSCACVWGVLPAPLSTHKPWTTQCDVAPTPDLPAVVDIPPVQLKVGITRPLFNLYVLYLSLQLFIRSSMNPLLHRSVRDTFIRLRRHHHASSGH